MKLKIYRIDVKQPPLQATTTCRHECNTRHPGPLFCCQHSDYTVDVATDVTEVTVAATKSDPDAVMSGSLTAGQELPRDGNASTRRARTIHPVSITEILRRTETRRST